MKSEGAMKRGGSVAGLIAVATVAVGGCSVFGGSDEPRIYPETSTVTVAVPPPAASGPPAPGSTTAPPSAAPAPIALANSTTEYTFVQTKSGKARCRVSATGAGCQLTFDDPAPTTQSGDKANGVNVGSDGTVTYVLGDIGVADPTTLDYQTYTARGWTIEADSAGTTFTNDATGRGMTVSTSGARGF